MSFDLSLCPRTPAFESCALKHVAVDSDLFLVITAQANKLTGAKDACPGSFGFCCLGLHWSYSPRSVRAFGVNISASLRWRQEGSIRRPGVATFAIYHSTMPEFCSRLSSSPHTTRRGTAAEPDAGANECPATRSAIWTLVEGHSSLSFCRSEKSVSATLWAYVLLHSFVVLKLVILTTNPIAPRAQTFRRFWQSIVFWIL